MRHHLVPTLSTAALAFVMATTLHAQLTPPPEMPKASTPHAVADPYHRCLVRAGNNAVQQGMCVQVELAHQDARLNYAYVALLNRSKAGSAPQEALRVQERAWLKQRDTVCKINKDTVDNVCLLDRTTQRADELEARLAQ